MILSRQTIRRITGGGGSSIVKPLVEREVDKGSGMTYGLGPCGVDIRIAKTMRLWPGGFALASSIEEFSMPSDVIGMVKDKSTLARRGVAVQNTVIEPGWRGYLTLELTNHNQYRWWHLLVWWKRPSPIQLTYGQPIAQVVFSFLDVATDQPYNGKYQDQPRGPTKAIFEVK